MFRKKEEKWLKTAQYATKPVSIKNLSKTEHKQVVANFLRHKIGTMELNGIVTPDNTLYIPISYIEGLIAESIREKGFTDICDLIDKTNLPGEILEIIMLRELQEIDGFFDLIRRFFYTPFGAIRKINRIIGKSTSIDLKYLLNELFWSEDHLEAVLDIMSQEGSFIGYIDPKNQRLYNFTSLDFSSPKAIAKNFRFFENYLRTVLDIEHEVSIEVLMNLTRLSSQECLKLIEQSKKTMSFIYSTNKDYLYSTEYILLQVLKDIYVYHDIPIAFWLKRLDVDRSDFLKFLEKLNTSLKGNITKEDYFSPSLLEWFNSGIDVEGLSQSLNLTTKKLLDILNDLGFILKLKLVAGDTSEPFLVKGIPHLEIFCQLDTSSHTDPKLYFECQNCRRIICSNCRTLDSSHECPFCGNISAFIINLPRSCTRCNITYTHSYNLISTEECYFCNKGPLKEGWVEYKPKRIDTKKQMNDDLLSFISQVNKEEIPLRAIFNEFNKEQSELITDLENLILYQKLEAWIDIRLTSLVISEDNTKKTCMLCSQSFSIKEGATCVNCKKSICLDCYNELEAVGMQVCPECGGELVLHSE
ncbi:MAG: hypothetical protein ACTSW1_04655 [Candidatus Hodarchaeales archaeon]